MENDTGLIKLILALLHCCVIYYYLKEVDEFQFGRGPQVLFVLYYTFYFFLTLIKADFTKTVDILWTIFILLGFFVFILGCTACKIFKHFENKSELKKFANANWIDDIHGSNFVFIFGLGILCIIIAAIYFQAVGHYIPLEALISYTQTADVGAFSSEYSEIRKAFHYGTKGYFAPGYVAQFKDWLLPMISVLMYFRWRMRRKKCNGLLFITFFLLAVLATVGTGRRGALIIFMFFFIYWHTWQVLTPINWRKKTTIAYGIMALIFIGILNSMMARQITGSFVESVTLMPIGIIDRLFLTPPETALLFNRIFVDVTPIQWGKGWVASMMGILPGTQMGLSNELHAILFGSMIGSAPLDLWGELKYNFGWGGGICLCFAVGWIMQYYYIKMIRGPKTISRVIPLAFGVPALAFANEPFAIFNNGVVTMMIFILITKFVKSYDRKVFRY